MIKHQKRSSGILLHITSLPGKYGIGSMGQEAFDFVDFLVLSGQKIWQILPLGHTGYGDSPYQCFSAFSGNPLLINLEKLVDMDLLSKDDLPDNIYFDDEKVDFGKVFKTKYPVLKKSFSNFKKKSNKLLRIKFEKFCLNNELWINDYSLFMALKDHFHGKPWTEWDEDIKKRKGETVDYYKDQLRDDIEFYRFIQYLFYKQWLDLKSYANLNDISIIGDLPIYVAFDSADAWSKPEIFDFDEDLNPINVAGVPPDYFSATGQLWGNPLYKWDKLKEDNFKWWIDRVSANFTLYDMLRIDHFRGLAAFWAVPFGEETAVNGQWIKAPGAEMLQAVFDELGPVPIIAEDLGVITDDVVELRMKFNLPGMKILQFAFDSGEENDFIPHNFGRNYFVYTGTHDNDTTLGHFTAASEQDKAFMREYFNIDESDPAWSFIKLAWSTVANLAVAPLQDVLRLGSEARMNFPGKGSGFWRWRYHTSQLKDEHAEQLLHITKLYGRF